MEELDICTAFDKLVVNDSDGLFMDADVKITTRNEALDISVSINVPLEDVEYEKLSKERWSNQIVIEKWLIEKNIGKTITWRQCYENMDKIHTNFAGKNIGVKYAPFSLKKPNFEQKKNIRQVKRQKSNNKKNQTTDETNSIIVMSIGQLYAVVLHKTYKIPEEITKNVQDINDKKQMKDYEKLVNDYVEKLPGKLCVKSLESLTHPWKITKSIVCNYISSFIHLELLYVVTNDNNLFVFKLPSCQLVYTMKLNDIFGGTTNILDKKVVLFATKYFLFLSIDGKKGILFLVSTNELINIGEISPKQALLICSISIDDNLVVVGCENGNVDFWKVSENHTLEYNGSKNYFRNYITESGEIVKMESDEPVWNIHIRGSKLFVSSDRNFVMVDMCNAKYGITICAINDAETIACVSMFGDLIGTVDSRGILMITEFGSGKIFHNSVFVNNLQPVEQAITIGSQLCVVIPTMMICLLPDGTLAILDQCKPKK